jgi:hypothetical protein
MIYKPLPTDIAPHLITLIAVFTSLLEFVRLVVARVTGTAGLKIEE